MTQNNHFIKHSEYFSTEKLISMLFYLRNICSENADINYFDVNFQNFAVYVHFSKYVRELGS